MQTIVYCLKIASGNHPFAKKDILSVLQLFMRVYVDANIYIAYLLGENGEINADKFFKKGIECKFTIIASKTTFAEISLICGKRANILLQKHIDDFKNAGKLEVIEETNEQTQEALRLNENSKKKYGLNDFIHALLAKKHADVFVTNDFKFLATASKIVKTTQLESFLSELEA